MSRAYLIIYPAKKQPAPFCGTGCWLRLRHQVLIKTELVLTVFLALIEGCVRLPERKVELMLNEDALRRVFENIISNAVKYTDGDLRVDMTADGMVTFSNHAAGLTELQAERLFDRFYTVNTARKSTGLGLAIARTLTEKMSMEIGAVCEDQILKVWVRPKE